MIVIVIIIVTETVIAIVTVIVTVSEIAIVIVNASTNLKTLNFKDPLKNYRSLNVACCNLIMFKHSM